MKDQYVIALLEAYKEYKSLEAWEMVSIIKSLINEAMAGR